MTGLAKWLVSEPDKKVLEEVFEIRTLMSKKQPDARRKEVIEFMSENLFDLISNRAKNIAQTSFGCQFITETLLSTPAPDKKETAKSAVATIAEGDPSVEGHVSKIAAAGRMLKTLVLGGQFDSIEKKVQLAEPHVQFATTLWPVIKDSAVEWACSDSSFVVVALLESEDVDDAMKTKVMKAIKKGKKSIEAAAKGAQKDRKGNAGAKILVEKMG